MSVLIKGMEMPKNCDDCLLAYDSIICSVTREPFYKCGEQTGFDSETMRLPSCPLVPVPPHGRLIDVDLDGDEDE